MTTENPYESPEEQADSSLQEGGGETSAERAAYNTVTDLVAGPNVRLSDNLFQAACIGICLVLGIAIGLLVGSVPGAILGGLIGLVAGLFGSGIFLMIYRAVRHVRGKHD